MARDDNGKDGGGHGRLQHEDLLELVVIGRNLASNRMPTGRRATRTNTAAATTRQLEAERNSWRWSATTAPIRIKAIGMAHCPSQRMPVATGTGIREFSPKAFNSNATKMATTGALISWRQSRRAPPPVKSMTPSVHMAKLDAEVMHEQDPGGSAAEQEKRQWQGDISIVLQPGGNPEGAGRAGLVENRTTHSPRHGHAEGHRAKTDDGRYQHVAPLRKSRVPEHGVQDQTGKQQVDVNAQETLVGLFIEPIKPANEQAHDDEPEHGQDRIENCARFFSHERQSKWHKTGRGSSNGKWRPGSFPEQNRPWIVHIATAKDGQGSLGRNTNLRPGAAPGKTWKIQLMRDLRANRMAGCGFETKWFRAGRGWGASFWPCAWA